MKANYDRETDILTIVLREAKTRESDEVRPGVIADFGYDGGWCDSPSSTLPSRSRMLTKCSSQWLINQPLASWLPITARETYSSA